MRGLRKTNISFEGHSIKQHETVEFLGSQLESKFSEEAMASKILRKINAKLKSLYCQSYIAPVRFKENYGMR